MTLDETLNTIITVATAVVTISSLLASGVNWLIRVRTSSGRKVPPFVLALASVLNTVSMNLDKAVQQVNMARGVPTTSTGGVIQPPAEPTPAVLVPGPTEVPKS